MSGSRGRGYRSPRLTCPQCGRDTACSARLQDGGWTRLRRHNRPGTSVPCGAGGTTVSGRDRQAPGW